MENPNAENSAPTDALARDPRLRDVYARAAMRHIPRLLTALDRNPMSPSYGCLDRQYWHYRTADFPSEMYQEGALALAQVYTYRLPGNRWFCEPRIRDFAIAALRFSARSCHRDASCDDYYPFERALGAAVFSLNAAAKVYELLRLDDAEIFDWLIRRADWIIHHDETGRLANHHALAALALLRVARLSGQQRFFDAADQRTHDLLQWQSDEGWFEEYGGADPGYQTLTIDCLANFRRLRDASHLDEPLRRAVSFARWFLHPDDSYAGHYGSRGTYHAYAHGLELLAGHNPAAAQMAEGLLRGLDGEKQACFDDDRLVAHRVGNWIDAWIDWTGHTPAVSESDPPATTRYFPQAGLLVHRTDTTHTVVSAARGNVFKHFVSERSPWSDAGLLVQTTDGRTAASQVHDLERDITFTPHDETRRRDQCVAEIRIEGPLHWISNERMTTGKLILFRLATATVGRFCRGLLRRLLQRRLITGRRPAGLWLMRTVEVFEVSAIDAPLLRVTDTLRITDPRLRVQRMAVGSDHETAYVAASGVYQDAVLAPWLELDEHVDELNRCRGTTIIRSN